MRLCKDCVHALVDDDSRKACGDEHATRYAKCAISGEIDLVDGVRELSFCRTERKYGECGPGGKYYWNKDGGRIEITLIVQPRPWWRFWR